jgi:prepilin-type N-terminal cleavage/methylation domain-containing protein
MILVKKNKGFTLLEILLVIAIISILAVIVILALNPSKQLADTRNSQRRSDIKTLANAVYQYSIDHNGEFPPPIDSAMRSIGNGPTGCDIICGNQLAQLDNNPKASPKLVYDFKNPFINKVFAYSYKNDEIDEDKPKFISTKVSPVKVWPGDTLTIKAQIKDKHGIKSIKADMGGIETIKLKLINGNQFDGLWEAKWQVYNTEEKQYTTTLTALNNLEKSSKKQITWLDPPPTDWILPTSTSDPSNQWSNEAQIYDGNTGTYGSNNYGGTGWGQFIIFNLATPILSDRLRVNADYIDAQIAEVDIDVFIDGAWVDVFQGGSEATWNDQWVEIPYTKGTVSQARFRYNYNSGGYYFWLYEFQFYEASATITLPACSTKEAISIQEEAAILQGLVSDDGGEPCETRFEYGESTSYSDSTSWENGDATGEIFAETITGLTNNTTYHFRGQIRNSAGTVNCPDTEFTTEPAPIGWVLPIDDDDPSGTWTNTTSAYDNNTSTYARNYHDIGETQWSEYFYLLHSPMKADKVQFYARGGNEVSSVDIDVYKDGAWEDVFEGSFTDKDWIEKTFSEGIVEQVRIRFYATYANHGFFFELYELSFYKTSLNNSIQCADLEPFLVPTYLTAIPTDPSVGTSANSHYAIRKNNNNRITVYSCDPELEKEIIISR